MARVARIVAAVVRHHVTHGGDRRQRVFFSDSDYECYRAMLAEGCRRTGVGVPGYCLMAASKTLFRLNRCRATSAGDISVHHRGRRTVTRITRSGSSGERVSQVDRREFAEVAVVGIERADAVLE